MSTVDLGAMLSYLGKSYSSINQNKLRGLLAEIEFRKYLATLGFANRVSVGGWIARSEGPTTFARDTIVIFPETLDPNVSYPPGRALPPPPHALHTVCAAFHQIGIKSYFCVPEVPITNDPASITWKACQLGLPIIAPYAPFPACVTGFRPRVRKYNYLRYKTNASSIPAQYVPEEFTKENLRVAFNTPWTAEVSDVDGIFWGQQYTYPIEVKEKTAASSRKVGDYFGLDLGPFVKLAFYAARQGNLRSLFVVREINNTTDRVLVDWWFIPFDRLAMVASWIPMAGGQSMGGGGSSVVMIPKSEFQRMTAATLAAL